MAPPGAVGDEDALPDGQRAVVPQQQEVEDGVQEPAGGRVRGWSFFTVRRRQAMPEEELLTCTSQGRSRGRRGAAGGP